MTPPLSKEQENALYLLYYTKGFTVGANKLYQYLKEHNPELQISFRQVSQYLNEQPSYQINKQPRNTTRKVKPILSTRKHQILQMDLIDFSQNQAPNQYKYIVNIIDVFSRYVFLYKIKNKKAETILKVFTDFYNLHVKPYEKEYPVKKLITDQGGEFALLDPFLKEHHILHIQSTSPQSQSIVERSNQSVRRILAKYCIVMKSSNMWNAILPTEEIYNHTYHRGINDTPYNIYELSDPEKIQKFNEQQQITYEDTLIERTKKGYPLSQSELQKDDKVRIRILKKSALDKTKGFNNWSEDVYTIFRHIKARKLGNLDRYELLNEKDEKLKKQYYRDDLLKIP